MKKKGRLSKRLQILIGVFSLLIAIMMVGTFYTESKIDKYHSSLEDTMNMHNNRLLNQIRVESQLAIYLQVVPFPNLYDVYFGKDYLKEKIHNLSLESEALSKQTVDLANEHNQLREKGTIWTAVKQIIQILMLILILINASLSLHLVIQSKLN